MTPIATITDFAAQAADAHRYTPLGDGWWIAVADVVGSTRLASEGRHRDVNFVAGAAVAVLSTLIEATGETPCCQFGGDGALAAVPQAARDAAHEGLAALAWWSIHEMGVPIRVGLVPVSELVAAGLDVRVALQDLGGGNVFGLFMGDGVSRAEEWVKGEPARQIPPHRFPIEHGALPGLEGLSCRWTPVPSGRGTVLCVIIDPVVPGDAGAAILRRIQAEIEAVVDTDDATPLSRNGERLKPRWPPSLHALILESRAAAGGPGWGGTAARVARVAKAVLSAAFIAFAHAAGRKLLGFDPRRYRRAIAERSDYRKAAGGPRMVLDVTEAEARAIEELLERAVATGDIRYGVARADTTTITCHVGDFQADRHVHFVDGGELGFWRASKALKSRFGTGTDRRVDQAAMK